MRLMNLTSPTGEGEDNGELYEPHQLQRAESDGKDPPKLLNSKEKIEELTQLLEQRNLEQAEL